MSRNQKRLILVTLITVIAVGLGLAILGPKIGHAASSGVLLTGTIQSASGEKMEGVTVSARPEGSDMTTSVFTDAQGEYYFPRLEGGQYKVWAQAVGYDAGRAEVALVGSVRHEDFVLKTKGDFSMQLTGDMWVAALPEDTPEDRKMKQVFANNCVGCHPASFPLEKRFDEQGWEKIITLMSRITITGNVPDVDEAPGPVINYYKKDLAAYLARMRGPGPSPMQFKARPRPTGDATLAVFTEYEVPERDGDFAPDNGSDWSLGTVSSFSEQHHHSHDAVVDSNGNIWFTDSLDNHDRTIGKIDAKTGKVTPFKVPGADGTAVGAHEIIRDQNGMIWFNVYSPGRLARIDPGTEKIEIYTPPKGMGAVGAFINPDGKGGIWCLSQGSALRFDPETGKFTEFKNPTQLSEKGETGTYGITGDSEGNGWWSQFGIDNEVHADVQTSKVEDVHFPARVSKMTELFAADSKLYDVAGGNQCSSQMLLWGEAPRRPGGDLRGDVVWVPLWFGGTLAKINIHTRKITTYPFPRPDMGGYQAQVDKDHMVWVNFLKSDSIGKFNPTTEKWTEYPLPTLGAETHGLHVTDNNGSAQVSVAYLRTGKVARLQVRTRQELQSLKAEIKEAAQVQ